MPSLIAVILVALSALLVYKKRFTSERRIGGLYSVQLYYLILSLFVPMLFLNLGLDIMHRPEVKNLPLPSMLLFDFYVISLVCAAIGVGIHATSTSVYQSFVSHKHTKLEAYKINEKFHGYLSHHMTYSGGIVGLLSLSLLEFNHPVSQHWNSYLLIAIGIAIGVIGSIAIIWSTYTINWFVYIGFNLLAALLSVTIIVTMLDATAANLVSQPITRIMLTALITITAALTSYSIIFLTSDRMTAKLLRRLFPKNHDFRKAPTIKFLGRKVERVWVNNDYQSEPDK